MFLILLNIYLLYGGKRFQNYFQIRQRRTGFCGIIPLKKKVNGSGVRGVMKSSSRILTFSQKIKLLKMGIIVYAKIAEIRRNDAGGAKIFNPFK